MSDMSWCPIGTCHECDALRYSEQQARCPNQTSAETHAKAARDLVVLSDRETAIALIGALAGMALNETDHGMPMRYALAAWVIGSFLIIGVIRLFRWIERRIKPRALAIVERIARSLTPPPPTR